MNSPPILESILVVELDWDVHWGHWGLTDFHFHFRPWPVAMLCRLLSSGRLVGLVKSSYPWPWLLLGFTFYILLVVV